MRIVFATGIYPPQIGGPATYVSGLARALAAEGDGVKVVTYGDAPPQDERFPVFLVPRGASLPGRYGRFLAAVRRACHDAEIVYLQDPLSSGLPGVLAARSRGRPAVVKIVGDLAWEIAAEEGWIRDGILEFQHKTQRPVIELARRAQRFVARSARRVIVPCRFLKDLVAGWGVPPQHIHVIHNSLPDAPTQTDSRERARHDLGLNEDDVVLISAGRMVPWKGFDRLVRITARVAERSPRLRLRIVGHGPCEREVKQQALALGLEQTVSFTGPLDHEATIRQLRAADVLVLLSDYEGFSHLILEAMREALPVVATDVGGNRELVEEGLTGRLIPPEDEPQIEATLLRICRDAELRRRLGQAGRERARQLTWESMVRQTRQVLQSCLDETGAPPATSKSSR